MAGALTEQYATVDARITGIRKVKTPHGERIIAKAALEDESLVVLDLDPAQGWPSWTCGKVWPPIHKRHTGNLPRSLSS